VVREPDLRDPSVLRGSHILNRVAHGMMAEGRMNMIVGSNRTHEPNLIFPEEAWQRAAKLRKLFASNLF
jgi:hypothetical protein